MDSEDPLLIQTDRGLTARYRGIYLYPQDNPQGYGRRRALAAEILPRTLVYVPSVGLGHGLADLIERLPDDSAVICIEIDQKIMALASSLGLPRDPRLTIIRTQSEEAVASVLASMGPGRLRRVTQVVLSAGYRLSPDLYESFRNLLDSEIRAYWQNKMTLVGMGSLWVRNLFDNLSLLPDSKDFSVLSTQLPVVVAGAGPSLDGSIPLLRKLRQRYLLVAVDTALPILAAHSIAPDVVVALEAQSSNIADFLPFRDPSIPLICELSSFPPALRLFRGNLFFFSSSFAPISLFDRLRSSGLLPCRFPALGSVGVAATHAALCLTRREVVLTGLDFAYTGGRTHARGVSWQLAALASTDRVNAAGQREYSALVSRPLLRERDKRGRLIVTDLILKSYKDRLNRSLAPESHRVWDAGAAGLSIGARQATEGEIEDMLGSGIPAGGLVIAEKARSFAGSEVGAFIEGERKLLEEADRSIMGILSAGPLQPRPWENGALLRAVDYAYVHFPDEPDLENGPEKSFLARALVAVRYYAQRLARIGANP